jgi:GMP synthase-like glutamine amidotransferase
MKYNTHAFDVVHKREYPTDSDLENIDALVISGSFEDDADHDVTWILRLAGFLIKVHDDFPRIRILGICFGLQILARAFGPSPIVQNEKGW